MGDYTKLIVHCEVECDKEELESQIRELGLCDSAYHCNGVIQSISNAPDVFDKTRKIFVLHLTGQTKYGGGQAEFLDWLESRVVQGFGLHDCYAIQFEEYYREPKLYYLQKDTDHGKT